MLTVLKALNSAGSASSVWGENANQGAPLLGRWASFPERDMVSLENEMIALCKNEDHVDHLAEMREFCMFFEAITWITLSALGEIAGYPREGWMRGKEADIRVRGGKKAEQHGTTSSSVPWKISRGFPRFGREKGAATSSVPWGDRGAKRSPGHD